ncbi:Sphingoid long-chain bases kinase 1-like protein [Drosera capensis]
MHNGGSLQRSGSSRTASQQSLRRMGLCPQLAAVQHCSPVVFPEKRSKVKGSRRIEVNAKSGDTQKVKEEHRIDIGDELSNLLGYDIFSGKLVLDKRKTSKSSDVQTSKEVKNPEGVDAKLTSKALVWGPNTLYLEDVISVSFSVGLRLFTVHSYPTKQPAGVLSCFMKPQRRQKDFRFLATNPDEALQWVNGFADQQCFVNVLPHPLVSSKKQASDFSFSNFPLETQIRSKTPPTMLVILNPRSGRGRSTKVFHGFVEPIFKIMLTDIAFLDLWMLLLAFGIMAILAGFKLEVVKTESAGHARKLASSVDFSTCPDGIVCVGGDGIVNEVLNGLLSRENQKEAISIPIGIIPAGSDNSLVWTVLGVRDPVSAAIAIVKGGLTATDVFAVQWIQTGAIHFGSTVSYFGFVSDVLELSEKYQKRFGPLRYFVAGFHKFLYLPKYTYEVEYLPVLIADEVKTLADKEVIDMSDLYTDIMRRSKTESLPRASSMSSIDSIMSPSRISVVDVETTCSSTYASTEPSDYVRGIDPKSKRQSSGRRTDDEEPEVIHHPSTATNWPRTRSKSRTDKGWNGLTTTHDATRSSWGNAGTNDREDISSTVSDPGPIWDSEPKWDTEPNWDFEKPIELPGPPEPSVSPEHDFETAEDKDNNITTEVEENWVSLKGPFLGVLVCNHSCRTVQVSSQVVVPNAEPDDNALHLLLIHGSGQFKLLKFFLRLQLGRHLSLPYVEYVKVKSVKIKPGKDTQVGCGIDGELFPVHGQVVTSLYPEQCRLIGRPRSRQK